MSHGRPGAGPLIVRMGGAVVNLLLVVVSLGCAAYVVPSLLGYERYVITGGSMAGTIEKGSLVIERQVPVADLAVGDVITYLPPPDSGVSNLVTHRIVTRRPMADGTLSFRTQGDANADPDPWKFSLAQETQPVVEFSVPLAGQVLIALADRGTRMLVIGVPACVIALTSLAQLIRALRRGPVAAPAVAASNGVRFNVLGVQDPPTTRP